MEHKKEEGQTENSASTPGKESTTEDVKNVQAKQSEQASDSVMVDIPVEPLVKDSTTGGQAGEQKKEDGNGVTVDVNEGGKQMSMVDSCVQSEPLQGNEPSLSLSVASKTEGSDKGRHEEQNDTANDLVEISVLSNNEVTNDRRNVSGVKTAVSDTLMVDMGTQMSPMPLPVARSGPGRPPLHGRGGGKGAAKRKAKTPVREQVEEEVEEIEEESTEEEIDEDIDYEPPSSKHAVAIDTFVGGKKGHRPLTRSKSKGKKAKKATSASIKYKCTTCDFTCTVKSELPNHMMEVHNEVDIKVEDISDEVHLVESDNENTLLEGIPPAKRKPVSDTAPDDRYTCMICREFKCKFKKDLARHKHEAHNIFSQQAKYKYVSRVSNDRYKCMQCSYTCKFQRQLKGHKRRAHPRPKIVSSATKTKAKPKIQVPMDRYKCTECDFKCKFKGLLRAHRIKEHKKERPPAVKKSIKELECEHCGKIIRGTQHHLIRHLKTHTGEKPWECDICGALFAEKGRLNVHKPIHNEARPFLCEECGKSFKRAINLRMHRKIHVEVKPYQCELCAYRCTRHDTLNLHMKRKHLKLRRVLCTFCGKKFFSEKECQAHTSRKHLPRPTPFQCTLCPAAFPFAYNLRAHMKKHPEHKPYKCEYCGFESRSKASLQDHEKQHTGNTWGRGPRKFRSQLYIKYTYRSL